MKKVILFVSILVISTMMTGCASLQQLANLTNCKFRIASLTNAKLAGVNVQNVNSIKSLSLGDISKLTGGYFNKNLPLTFQLNVEAKNPNSSSAALSEFDWILTIDDIEMTRGSHGSGVSIPANGISTIPMQISFDLFNALKDESKDALLNFAFNLADAGNKPTRVGLKIKPTIYINQIPLTYPDYISVGTEFGNT